MNRYILYHTDTGFIESVLSLTDKSKQKMLDNNDNIAFMLGSVPDVNKYCVNVATDPHTIESKPAVVQDVDEYIRDLRTKLLKASDWTQAIDSPLSDSKKAEWQTYRQQLRDWPSTNTATTVADVVWPTKPE